MAGPKDNRDNQLVGKAPTLGVLRTLAPSLITDRAPLRSVVHNLCMCGYPRPPRNLDCRSFNNPSLPLLAIGETRSRKFCRTRQYY